MTPSHNEPSPQPTQSLLPRGSILLVDEEGKDLKCFTSLLVRMGFSVRAFLNYREAERCRVKSPPTRYEGGDRPSA